RGQPFYVTVFSSGTPLDRALGTHGPFDLGRSLRLTVQLLGALEAAHALKIVHRDLKPANLLLEEPEHLRVLDFGLVKLLGSDVPDLTGKRPVGTPLYMPPEQCVGDAITVASDIYSVACIFFELLTGTPPFNGGTALEILTQHVMEAPPELMSRAAV